MFFYPTAKVPRVCGLSAKLCLVMKMTAIILLISFLHVSATGFTQKISLFAKNKPLQQVFTEIVTQTGVSIIYDEHMLANTLPVTIEVKNVPVREVLDMCVKNQPIIYTIEPNNIVVINMAKITSLPLPLADTTITITGIVKDEKGEPIPGVTIQVKDTKRGTQTAANGVYKITIAGNEGVLVYSNIGFEKVERTVKGNMVVNISLKPASASLQDVVVVGYGAKKRETITGAINSINSKEIKTTTNTSLSQMLQGKIPGLQIRQNAGGPGDFNSMINIRGFGAPLYVIDGIPRDDGSFFQRLNPEEIESISVIKDASAAIYGLRAANGVIIVTTKKGGKGKTTFNYTGVVGAQRPTDVPRMANRAEWAQLRNDAAINAGGLPYFTKENLEQNLTGPSTDWYDETMKKAGFQQQHNISAMGGNDAVAYFANLGYVSEEGLLKSNDLSYKKYNFRTNLSATLSKHLKTEINLSGFYDKKQAPGQNFYGIFAGTRTALPNEPVYANNNPDYLALQPYLNPVALSERDLTGYVEDVNRVFQSSAALIYEVPGVKGLRLKGLAAYDNNNYSNKTLNKSYNLYTYDAANDKYNGYVQSKPSRISNYTSYNDRLTFQAHLLYDRLIADKHKIGVTLVYEQQQNWSRVSSLAREYTFFTNDQINQADLNNQKANGYENETASKSYIGRFNYDYKGRYFLEYAFRYDGSYRYHPDRRWGFFPVVSGGWRVSEEEFMKPVSFISHLKLRASYGLVGEDAGLPFQYVPGFSTSGGGGYEFADGTYTTGASSPAVTNENLTWFKSTISDIGIELSLLGKINFELDVYQRYRKGLLARRNVSLPNTFGSTLPEENINSDLVRGIDFSIGYQHNTGAFHYGIKGNFNFARTMNRYVERGAFLNSMDRWRSGASDRWSDVVWGYKLEGQFQNNEEIYYAPMQGGDLGNTRELPGDYRYKDMNEDGVIDGKDIVPLFWGGNPKLYYGLTLNASWKGFDFNALFQGAGKYSVRFREVYAEVFAFGLNTPAYFFDRWHKADPYDPNSEWVPGKWPATRFISNVGSMYAESIVWRKDASYMRLKSVELGYTFNPQALQKRGITSIRVFANAHNVYTWADAFVKQFDPEKIEGEYSAGLGYPLMRSFNAGINMNF